METHTPGLGHEPSSYQALSQYHPILPQPDPPGHLADHERPCNPRPPNPPPRPQPEQPPNFAENESCRYQTEFDLPPGLTAPVLPPPKLLPPQLDEKHRVRSTQDLLVSDGITLHSLLYKPQIEGTHFFTYTLTARSIFELITKEPEILNLAAINAFQASYRIELCMAALVEWSKLRKLLVRELRRMWETPSGPFHGRLSLYLWRFNDKISIIQVHLRELSSKLAVQERVHFRYIWRELDYLWLHRHGIETDFELLRLYDPGFFDALGRKLDIMADELQANDGLDSPNSIWGN